MRTQAGGGDDQLVGPPVGAAAAGGGRARAPAIVRTQSETVVAGTLSSRETCVGVHGPVSSRWL